MMTPQQFYLEHYDAGDPFGNTNPPRTTRHLGSDFNGMPGGTEIPSWAAGTVTAVGSNSVIGNYLMMRTEHGGWAGFYHMDLPAPHSVGEHIDFGELIGPLGQTGSAAIGNHLHAYWSVVNGTPGGGNVADPWPAIVTIISLFSGTSTAGVGGTTPIPPLSTRSNIMKFLRVELGPGHYNGVLISEAVKGGIVDQIDSQKDDYGYGGKPNNPRYALYEKIYGAGLNAADYTLTRAEFTELQKDMKGWPQPTVSGGGSTNIQPILDALAAGEAQDVELGKQLQAKLDKGLTGTFTPAK
jgi:hypothetical protein